MTAKPRRVRYEVLPISRADRRADTEGALEGKRWKVTRDSETIATFALKHGPGGALELAVTTARCAWQTQGQRGTLKIKGRSGRIIDERTYGADPTTTKG